MLYNLERPLSAAPEMNNGTHLHRRVLWLLGFGFHVGGGLIHLVLVIAAIVLVVNLLSGSRSVA